MCVCVWWHWRWRCDDHIGTISANISNRIPLKLCALPTRNEQHSTKQFGCGRGQAMRQTHYIPMSQAIRLSIQWSIPLTDMRTKTKKNIDVEHVTRCCDYNIFQITYL